MKVNFVIYGDINQRSGGYLYDRQLVDYLRGAGDQVDVISLPQRSYAASLLYNLQIDNDDKSDADLILQDELCHPSLFWSNRRVKSPRIIAIVHHLRSSEKWPSWQKVAYRLVESQYLDTVDGVICSSHETCRNLLELMDSGIPQVVAQPGRDHMSPDLGEDDLRQRSSKLKPLRLIYVGNLIPRKGLHTLLDALSELGHQEWDLTIVGAADMDPSYAASINRQIIQHEISDQVSVMGELSHDQVAEQLMQSHVLVVPSHHEGFGIAYLEGMGYGLPAIASSSGGASDIVRDGENGFLVPPEDRQTLIMRLGELMSDSDRLIKMGIAALTDYGNHPTWATSGRRIREFLVENVEAESQRKGA